MSTTGKNSSLFWWNKKATFMDISASRCNEIMIYVASVIIYKLIKTPGEYPILYLWRPS